ncbi:MAG: DUF3826 domain-containing protein [Sedimentisphaerales bacterium]|nr:DUF3826 domain-containing protein [Sedimentisphaerales bacterium]
MKDIRITVIVTALAFCAALSCAEAPKKPLVEETAAPKKPLVEETTAPRPLTKTVGIHTIKRTVNPDNTMTLRYRWLDHKLNKEVERSVILNEDTVIGINGEHKTFADVTDEALRAPSVATVGPDEVTAVSLRIGRQMIKVTQDDLTPKQVAQLKAAAPKATAASDEALEKRVEGIVASLKLNDAAKETRLRDVLRTNLKAVRDTHNAGFAPAKSVRQNLNKGLNADLTPEQVDIVKETLTHGVMKRTFDAYHQIVPQLTAEDDKVILEILRQAREEALDVKNAREIGPVFEPFKTRIEQYITSQGHDWRQAYKAFVDAQRAAQKAAEAANE